MSPTKYTYIFLALNLFIAMTVATVNIVFKERSTRDYQYLLQYQLKKIPDLNADDIVILGDSSGGNGLDAKLLSRLSDRKFTSLSLTGSFGYLGSIEIMKKSKKQGVKNFIIVNTPDMLQRTPAIWAKNLIDYAASKNLINSLKFPEFYLSFGNAIHFLTDNLTPPKKGLLENDYIPQTSRIKHPEMIAINLKTKFINPTKVESLRLLKKYCLDNEINCAYLHGPIHHSFCELSIDYLDKINSLLHGKGFSLVSKSPYCLNDEEIGDSTDHVDPMSKKKTTFYYFSLLKDGFL